MVRGYQLAHRYAISRAVISLITFAILVSGCGSGGAQNPSPSTATQTVVSGSGSASAAPKPESALVFGGPAGSLGDVFKAALKEFGAQYGIQTTYVEGNTSQNFSKGVAQKKAGAPEMDAILSTDTIDPLGVVQGIFAPVDPTLIPNLAHVPKSAVLKGNYGVVTGTNVKVLVYRTDMFQKRQLQPPTSWSDLWNQKIDCGIAVFGPTGGGGDKSIAMMNFVASNGNYGDFNATLDKLASARKNIVAFPSDESGAVTLLEQGTACLGATNQSRAVLSIANGAPVDLVVPKEGTLYSTNTAQLIAGAKHPIAAQLWIDYWLSEKVQTQLMTTGYTTPANTDVKRPTTGSVAKVVLATEFEKLKVVDAVPDGTFAPLDAWQVKWKEFTLK